MAKIPTTGELYIEVENIKDWQRECRRELTNAVRELGGKLEAGLRELRDTLIIDRREIDRKLNGRPSWFVLALITLLSSALVGLLVKAV